MNKLLKLFPLLALGAASALNGQITIAGWNIFNADGTAHNEAPDIVAANWTVNLATSALGSAVANAASSNDGVAGETGPTLAADASDNSGLYATVDTAAGNDIVTLTFTNNTGGAVNLSGFYYDYKKRGNATNGTSTVDYADIVVFGVSGITGHTDGAALHTRDIGAANFTAWDVDVDLTGKSIAAGATATFQIALVDNGAVTAPTWTKAVSYDNVALTAVPEPATFAILAGLAALGLVLHRRQRMS